MLCLGRFYNEGISTLEDLVETFKCFTKTSSLGKTFKPGLLYELERGCKQDHDKSASLFKMTVDEKYAQKLYLGNVISADKIIEKSSLKIGVELDQIESILEFVKILFAENKNRADYLF